MLISVLVQYLNANDAGPGFYDLATRKHLPRPRPSQDEKLTFWVQHVNAVCAYAWLPIMLPDLCRQAASCRRQTSGPAMTGPVSGAGPKTGRPSNALVPGRLHRWGARWGAIIGRCQATSGELKRSILKIKQA